MVLQAAVNRSSERSCRFESYRASHFTERTSGLSQVKSNGVDTPFFLAMDSPGREDTLSMCSLRVRLPLWSPNTGLLPTCSRSPDSKRPHGSVKSSGEDSGL